MTEQKEKQFRLLSQDEAGYVPVSPNLGSGQACAGCRWFYRNMEAFERCLLVTDYPEPIQQVGYCERFEAAPQEDESSTDIIIEADTVNLIEERSEKESNNRETQTMPGVWGTFKKWVGLGQEPTQSTFKALGNGYWFASYTNNFEDREGEILSEKAHDRYIARVNAGLVPMPELWHWHIPGTKHGETLAVWRDGHVICAAGVFDDTPAGRAAEKSYRKSKKTELSHGFMYPRWALKDGVYEDYNTFEITTLPPGKAANPYTTFEGVQKHMALTEEQKQSLKNTFGTEEGQLLIALSEQQAKAAKALADAGAKYKDFADVTPDDTTDQAGKADDGLKAFITDVVEGQADIATALDTMTKTFEAGMKQILETRKSLEAAIATNKEAHDAKMAELQAKIDAAPQRVHDAGLVPDSDNTEDAEKALKDMQSPDIDEELGIFATS